jgi:hypothetical protein
MHYAYYVGVSHWNPQFQTDSDPLKRMTRPDDFTDEELDPTKLLMSDMIMRHEDGTIVNWMYNHGTDGPHAVWDAKPETNPAESPTRTLGTNLMYGDGRVEWKSREQLHPDLMISAPEKVPHVGDQYY